MVYLLAIALGYLLGCSSMALYISKCKKVDIRAHGSGNLGTSNTAIVLGWGPAIAVGVHDIGKGALAVWLASFLFPDVPFVGALAGVACVFGHNYPFYLRFKGGKGFAAFVGMMLMLNWKMGLVILAAVVLITLVTDYLVLGTFTTIAAVPVLQGIENRSVILFLILLAGSAAILWQHRENITRLRNGTEIGLRSTTKGEHKVK